MKREITQEMCTCLLKLTFKRRILFSILCVFFAIGAALTLKISPVYQILVIIVVLLLSLYCLITSIQVLKDPTRADFFLVQDRVIKRKKGLRNVSKSIFVQHRLYFAEHGVYSVSEKEGIGMRIVIPLKQSKVQALEESVEEDTIQQRSLDDFYLFMLKGPLGMGYRILYCFSKEYYFPSEADFLCQKEQYRLRVAMRYPKNFDT